MGRVELEMGFKHIYGLVRQEKREELILVIVLFNATVRYMGCIELNRADVTDIRDFCSESSLLRSRHHHHHHVLLTRD